MAIALMGRKQAETLAVRALGWMAADGELTARFLSLSGAGPAELRARAGDPDLLGFVLDFLLAEETVLLSFCEAEQVRPEHVTRARAALPGGELPNWT